jgi:hypothetical protein
MKIEENLSLKAQMDREIDSMIANLDPNNQYSAKRLENRALEHFKRLSREFVRLGNSRV